MLYTVDRLRVRSDGMNKVIEIIGAETLKTLSKKYGRSESEIIDAALAGNSKVMGDIRKLIASLRK